MFCQFIPPGHPKYNRQKQYPLPIFAVNDAQRTTFRNAWIVSAIYKAMFLSIFGPKITEVEKVCNEFDESQKIMEDIITLYFKILNLWSRFHDYLLLFMNLDVGRQKDML